MVRFSRVLLAAAACLVLSSTQLAGQEARENNRVGFWGGFGLGAGLLGCLESGCSHDEWGFSGNGRLGGTLSPSLRLAGGTNGYYKQIDIGDEVAADADFTVGVVSFQALWYPKAGDFFLVGGVGFAWVETSVSSGSVSVSDSETGAGFVLGLGYDLPLNKSGSLALTPFANWVITTIDPTFDFLQFGLGLTFN